MATPQIPFKEKTLPAPIAGLVDEMLACYIDWREDAATARDAYGRWSTSRAGEAAQLFSAYQAALDQEESAATSYAAIVDDVGRWLHRAR